MSSGFPIRPIGTFLVGQVAEEFVTLRLRMSGGNTSSQNGDSMAPE
jgi:hypothetical protein